MSRIHSTLPNSRLILPEPTYSLPDRSKKSHARKQPEGHIPRPRNAFILFRCDFVRQKKIPESVESDHRNISRIVGKIWRQLSDQEKEPWVRMAVEEKHNHFMSHRYPGHQLRRETAFSKRRRNAPSPQPLPYDNILAGLGIPDDLVFNPIERPASCPPGALRTPSEDLDESNGYDMPMKVRDDLQRRPSRVTFYQSTPYDLPAGSGLNFFTEIVDQHYYTETIDSEKEQQGIKVEEEGSLGQGSAMEEFGENVSPEGEATFPARPHPSAMSSEWDSPAGIWNRWNQTPSGDGQDLESYYRPYQIPGSYPVTFPARLSFSTLPPFPGSEMAYQVQEGIYPLDILLDTTHSTTSDSIAHNLDMTGTENHWSDGLLAANYPSQLEKLFDPDDNTVVVGVEEGIQFKRSPARLVKPKISDIEHNTSSLNNAEGSSVSLINFSNPWISLNPTGISAAAENHIQIADEVIQRMSRDWLSDTYEEGGTT